MALPLPAHWDPDRIEEIRRVPYEARATEATAWAEAHDIGPAREDERRVALLLVDCQNTFCTPGFELFGGWPLALAGHGLFSSMVPSGLKAGHVISPSTHQTFRLGFL